MDITYHVEVDDMDDMDGEGRQFLESFIDGKPKALSMLRECRTHYPLAYLTKCVQTRCRDGRASSPTESSTLPQGQKALVKTKGR